MSKAKDKKGRRRFLKVSGVGAGVLVGGLIVGCNPIRRTIFTRAEKTIPPYIGKTEPMLWFQITPDNKYILHSSKVEMGQGTFTGLAQIAAEELGVNVEDVEVVHAQTDTGNIDAFATGGSLSIAGLYNPLREMGAAMREMLQAKAAEKLGVPVGDVKMENGNAIGPNKSLTYGEVVIDVNDWKVPKRPSIKERKDFKYIGKDIPRVDLVEKVNGAPIFGIDAEMEGMVYASLLKPAAIDASIKNIDLNGADTMAGVEQVIIRDEYIAVVASSYIEATQARRMIRYEVEINKAWDTKTLEEHIKVGKGTKQVVQKEGKRIEDISESGKVVEIEFHSPIGAHAQMEPNGAVASVKDGKATVILSTQVVSITRDEVAKALGFSKKDVNIIPTFLGGGFGRRLHTPLAVHAALLSQEIGKPVKCFMDRKQEFQNDTFRPPTHHVMKAKVSQEGKILGLEHIFASGNVMFESALIPPFAHGFMEGFLRADIGSIRGGSIMYQKLANYHTAYYHNKLPFATSFWRSLGLLANTFAIESFIDELALSVNGDPVTMRLEMLDSSDSHQKRIMEVIKTVAQKAGYTNEVVNGRAMGLAASIDAGSPCAQVAEVSIENNQIMVHKVTCAFDCGFAINPDQVKAQVEGCINMGISAAMFEKMDIVNNELQPINYGAYRMAMMKHSPKEIDTILIEGMAEPGPVGEPPLGPIGAAIANAVRRITGQRITRMPLEIS